MLGGLHAGGQQILGPAVIRMAAPGAPGCVTWLQAKSGCVAYARMLAPPGRANSTTGGLPPPPPTTSATFESEGVRISEAHKKQIREICSERDAQRAPGGNATDEAWRGLLDRARRIFRDAAVPMATCELLRACLAQRYARHPSEHLLAKVWAVSQKHSVEAATQQLVDLGVRPPRPRTERHTSAAAAATAAHQPGARRRGATRSPPRGGIRGTSLGNAGPRPERPSRQTEGKVRATCRGGERGHDATRRAGRP